MIKKQLKKALVVTLLIFSIGSINVYAHSGRTDSNGGHKDNQNKSGLGSYHYHCGGNPAHLHENGVCPYTVFTYNTQSTNNEPSIKKEDTTIYATGIQINEKIESIKEGEIKNLTATITPDNTTNKSITWETSNEEVVIVDSNGMVTAKSTGTVVITASTSNGKKATLEIKVLEKEETKKEIATNNIQIKDENNNTTNNSRNSESSNPIATLLGYGVIGGAGYYGYKKLKKK